MRHLPLRQLDAGLHLARNGFVLCGGSKNSKPLITTGLFFPCLSPRLFEAHPGSAAVLVDELDTRPSIAVSPSFSSARRSVARSPGMANYDRSTLRFQEAAPPRPIVRRNL